ncbi:MAG: hypothetical protein ABIR62_04175 [Dokdonella sp.]|uniref:hypothetical protein n=1 Tax=Dokdonella sp. TaxID=2291710 RepID=UPI0032673F62
MQTLFDRHGKSTPVLLQQRGNCRCFPAWRLDWLAVIDTFMARSTTHQKSVIAESIIGHPLMACRKRNHEVHYARLNRVCAFSDTTTLLA